MYSFMEMGCVIHKRPISLARCSSATSWMHERVLKGVKKACDWWGSSVTCHPGRSTLLALLLVAACALGLLNLKVEERNYKLWFPEDSNVAQVNHNQPWDGAWSL